MLSELTGCTSGMLLIQHDRTGVMFSSPLHCRHHAGLFQVMVVVVAVGVAGGDKAVQRPLRTPPAKKKTHMVLLSWGFSLHIRLR